MQGSVGLFERCYAALAIVCARVYTRTSTLQRASSALPPILSIPHMDLLGGALIAILLICIGAWAGVGRGATTTRYGS